MHEDYLDPENHNKPWMDDEEHQDGELESFPETQNQQPTTQHAK
jgi:hypothetical protein